MAPSLSTLLLLSLAITSTSASAIITTTSTPLAIPVPTPTTPDTNTWAAPIPPALQSFIAQFHNPHSAASPSEHDSDLLRKRQKGIGGPGDQGAGGAAGAAATTSIATQMSPITTYFVNGSPVVFTQTFAPTPDPWAGPVNGQIGLGTIQGNVGTVRSG